MSLSLSLLILIDVLGKPFFSVCVCRGHKLGDPLLARRSSSFFCTAYRNNGVLECWLLLFFVANVMMNDSALSTEEAEYVFKELITHPKYSLDTCHPRTNTSILYACTHCVTFILRQLGNIRWQCLCQRVLIQIYRGNQGGGMLIAHNLVQL